MTGAGHPGVVAEYEGAIDEILAFRQVNHPTAGCSYRIQRCLHGATVVIDTIAFCRQNTLNSHRATLCRQTRRKVFYIDFKIARVGKRRWQR